jgi:hypothetical protein
MKRAWHVDMGEMRNAYKILIRRSEGKRPFDIVLDDYFRMDLREIGWEDVDWVCLGQNRDQWQAPVNTVMGIQYCVRNSSFSSSVLLYFIIKNLISLSKLFHCVHFLFLPIILQTHNG